MEEYEILPGYNHRDRNPSSRDLRATQRLPYQKKRGTQNQKHEKYLLLYVQQYPSLSEEWARVFLLLLAIFRTFSLYRPQKSSCRTHRARVSFFARAPADHFLKKAREYFHERFLSRRAHEIRRACGAGSGNDTPGKAARPHLRGCRCIRGP